MRGRKVYGESQITLCPWCGSNATMKTHQGVPCCRNHTKAELPNMKCACGDWLDVAEGKWGAYFRCLTCGNKSFSKGLEMNSLSIGTVPNSVPEPTEEETAEGGAKNGTFLSKKEAKKKEAPKEITVTSDDADFIYEMYR